MKSQSIMFAAIIASGLAVGPRAWAGDANYVLGFTNLTGVAVTVTLAGDHSSCYSLDDHAQMNRPYTIEPNRTHYIGFWRSGGCHGKQGWIGVRYSGASLPQPQPGRDDYEQFWYDSDGGFEKARDGQRARAPNRLESYGRTMGDTVFLRDVITSQ